MEKENWKNTDWLKVFAEDASLWEERAYDEMPAVIAHEYYRLHELAEQGNVYGVMLQLKDTCEILIKYPTILGLCILEQETKTKRCKEDKGMSNTAKEVEQFYKGVVAEALGKPMAIGDWIERARELKNKKLPFIMYEILSRSLDLFSSNKKIGRAHGIVNWRNITIGHGCLRVQNDKTLQSEIKSLFEMLTSYYSNDIVDIYAHIVLKQGNRSLVGKDAAKEVGEMPFALMVSDNKTPPTSYPTSEFIFPFDGKIYFFDSYKSKHKESTFLDYVEGHPKFVIGGFFSDRYQDLKEDKDAATRIKQMEQMETEVGKYSKHYITKEIRQLWHEMDETPIFIPPVYIYNWISSKLQEDDKGCYILKMERGMGKSALSAALDSFFNTDNPHITESAIISTYHCSRNQLHTAKDFVTSLNRIVLQKTTAGEIDEIPDDIKIIINEKQTNSSDTAKLLNSLAHFFHNEFGKKVVLLIDGIDEIINLEIFDYFPISDELEKGVYVFYTSRHEKELPVEMANRINRITIDDEYRVFSDNKEYRNLILRYAKTEMMDRYGKDKSSQEYKILAKKADYSFLKLRLYMPVYCSGKAMEWSVLGDERSMFEKFLVLLKNNYGEKFYSLHVKPLLVIFSIFVDGLTFKALSGLLNGKENDFMLLAVLNDLKGVLSTERSNDGNIYSLANEEYVNCVRREYFELRREYIDKYFWEIKNIAKNIYEKYDLWDLNSSPVFINCINNNDLKVRSYLKNTFVNITVFREKFLDLFYSIKTNSLLSPYELLDNDLFNIDFLEDLLFIMKCMGFDFDEYCKSYEVLKLLGTIIIEEIENSINNNYVDRIGEKLIYACVNYSSMFGTWMKYKTRQEFDERFKTYFQLVLDECKINNPYKMFIYIPKDERLTDYILWLLENGMNNIFERCEKDIISMNMVEVFRDMVDVFPFGSIDLRPYFSNNKVAKQQFRAWVKNLCLNCDIYNQPFEECKSDYNYILQTGSLPRYIEAKSHGGEGKKFRQYFLDIIGTLHDNNEMEYSKIQFFNGLSSIQYSIAPWDLYDKFKFIASKYIYEIIEFCRKKCIERKRYYEELLENGTLSETTQIYDQEINKLNGPISTFFAMKYPDKEVDINHFYNSEAFIEWESKREKIPIELAREFSHINHLFKNDFYYGISYIYRVDKKEVIDELLEWLHEYKFELLRSDKLSWIYFCEFHICFDYMLEHNRDIIYLLLKRNKLWEKIWDKIITWNYIYGYHSKFNKVSSRTFEYEYSLNYIVFVSQYAYSHGMYEQSKEIVKDFINFMCQHFFCDIKAVLTWIVCHQLLRKMGEERSNLYIPFFKELSRLDCQTNHDEFFYDEKIRIYFNCILCAFVFNDNSKILSFEREIKNLVNSIKQKKESKSIVYINDNIIEAALLQLEVVKLVRMYIKGNSKIDIINSLSQKLIIKISSLINQRGKYSSDNLLGFCVYKFNKINLFNIPLLSLFLHLCKAHFSKKDYISLILNHFWIIKDCIRFHAFSYAGNLLNYIYSYDIEYNRDGDFGIIFNKID